MSYSIIAVFIIIIIVLIFLTRSRERATIKKSKPLRKNDVLDLLLESAGTFDKPAKEALVATEQNPTPVNRMIHGDIIRFNAAGGEPRGNMLRSVISDYTAAVEGLAGHDDANLQTTLRRTETLLGELAADNENDDDVVWAINQLERIGATTNQVGATSAGVTNNPESANIVKAQFGGNRAKAAKALVEHNITHTSDPQNVHDSNVNADMRATLAKLKAVDSNAVNDAAKWINEEWDERKTFGPAALSAVALVSKANNISTFETTELDIFQRVWCRCKDPANINNMNILKGAVARALADCISNAGEPVCINGRCTRIIGALALIDYDPSVGSASTYESYKNQILSETSVIIDKVVAAAPSDVAASWKSGADLDPAVERGLKSKMREKIINNLVKYSDKLSAADLSRLRDQCMAFENL